MHRLDVSVLIFAAPGKVPPPPKFYTKKPSYGKQPSYLMRFKREVEEQAIQAQVKAKKDAEEALARQGFAPLPEDERQKILEGLRANLEKVTFEYGKISMVVDTIGKIRRSVLARRSPNIYSFPTPISSSTESKAWSRR